MYVHAGWEEGAGRGEKWLPLHLGEMKSPQSLERRKTLAGQKSNSQGRRRERKIYQTFSFALWQIVYVVRPKTWCGNSELLYMKCTFNADANFWATCERLPDCSDLLLCAVFHSMIFQYCCFYLPKVSHHVVLYLNLILVKLINKCNLCG